MAEYVRVRNLYDLRLSPPEADLAITLPKWPAFDRLPDERQARIKYVCVIYFKEQCNESGAIHLCQSAILYVIETGECFMRGEEKQLGLLSKTECRQLDFGGRSLVHGACNNERERPICALVSQDGLVWTLGNNHYGQLGRECVYSPDGTAAVDDIYGHYDPEPAVVPGLNNIIQVSCGYNHVLALTQSGQVYSWGNNVTGAVCPSNAIHKDIIRSPILAFSDDEAYGPVNSVDSCNYTSLAVLESGKVLIWGGNESGERGSGEARTGIERVYLLELPGQNIVQVACGSHHVLARTFSGQAFGWGANKNKQLIDSEVPKVYAPLRLQFPEHGDTRVRDIAATGDTSAFCLFSGDHYARGDYKKDNISLTKMPLIHIRNVFAEARLATTEVMLKADHDDYEARFNTTREAVNRNFIAQKENAKLRDDIQGLWEKVERLESDKAILESRISELAKDMQSLEKKLEDLARR